MRYRFISDFSLLSSGLEHKSGVRREVLRRFGSRLAASSDLILFLPEHERTLLVTSFVNALGPEIAALPAPDTVPQLPVAAMLSALMLDFWPSYATANGLSLQAIHSSIQKKQPDFLVAGLNHLALNLRGINRLPDETGVVLRLVHATVAALRPRDLAALSGKDKTPATLFAQLDTLHPEDRTGLPPLLEGLVSEIRLEHLKRLVSAEDREHTLDFSLLERFADCEHERKRFFSAPPPGRIPPLPEHLVDSLRLRKKSLPPDPGAHSADAEEAYFGRLDVLLGAERVLLLAQGPGKHCFTHLEALHARHGKGEAQGLIAHALACERCSAILSVVPLHETRCDKRLPRALQRRMRARLHQHS